MHILSKDVYNMADQELRVIFDSAKYLQEFIELNKATKFKLPDDNKDYLAQHCVIAFVDWHTNTALVLVRGDYTTA